MLAQRAVATAGERIEPGHWTIIVGTVAMHLSDAGFQLSGMAGEMGQRGDQPALIIVVDLKERHLHAGLGGQPQDFGALLARRQTARMRRQGVIGAREHLGHPAQGTIGIVRHARGSGRNARGTETRGL